MAHRRPKGWLSHREGALNLPRWAAVVIFGDCPTVDYQVRCYQLAGRSRSQRGSTTLPFLLILSLLSYGFLPTRTNTSSGVREEVTDGAVFVSAGIPNVEKVFANASAASRVFCSAFGLVIAQTFSQSRLISYPSSDFDNLRKLEKSQRRFLDFVSVILFVLALLSLFGNKDKKS